MATGIEKADGNWIEDRFFTFLRTGPDSPLLVTVLKAAVSIPEPKYGDEESVRPRVSHEIIYKI